MADGVDVAATHEVETSDVEYRRAPAGPLLARLYRPRGAGPFPALLDAHGGAWTSGDRLNNAPLDVALAGSGIVVLAIDFRMPPEHRYPAAVADIHFATRWLKAHAKEFGSRGDLVGGLGTSSGAHQLLLSALRPNDSRYAAVPLAEAPGERARLPYLVLCWPVADPLARYRMVVEKANARLVEAHRAYWLSETEMAEGNPQLILDREAVESLPQALLIQGTADDNVTPDMAGRFAAAWRRRGGRIELHEFAGQPHTFVVRDPASAAARHATELIRDFVLAQATV